MDREELQEKHKKHQLWVAGRDGGEQADFTSMTLSDAQMSFHGWNKAIFRHTVFIRCDLSDAAIREADLQGASLRYCNLGGIVLAGSNCDGVDFTGSDLTHANLRRCNLHAADLTRVDLRGADLSFANVENAKFVRTTFNSTHLDGTNLIVMELPWWRVTITPNRIQIGCKTYPPDVWRDFDDETIHAMDKRAVPWWKTYKEAILAMADTVQHQKEEDAQNRG